MKSKMKRTAAVIVPAFLVLALLVSVLRGRNVEVDSGYRLTMGTFARIVAIAPNMRIAEKGIEEAFARQERIEELMSFHKADSQLNQVNTDAYRRPVNVHPMTFEVAQKAIEASKLSQGAFDVTIGPLVELWRKAGDANRAPTDRELSEARARVGYEKLTLDPNELTIKFAVEGMKLDLGGIAKGYAIDKSVEALRASGAVGGMVDIGGDICCFGSPEGRTHWRIGVQDPTRPNRNVTNAETLMVLELKPPAGCTVGVATSGNYQRFEVVEGKQHSHIIDAKSGQSSDKLASVTIIAPNATTADAMATAVSVLGVEKGLELIERTPDVEAILMPAALPLQIIKSSGAQAYISE